MTKGTAVATVPETSGTPAPLTATETTRLKGLEDEIAFNAVAFVTVGLALMEIRDGRLYRTTYSTFEAYCVERWDFQRDYADRQIKGAKVQAALTPIGVTLPNEGTARQLTGLLDQPKILAKVGKALAAQPKITAASAKEAVDAALPPGLKPAKVTKTAQPDASDAQIIAMATEALKDVRLALTELKKRKYNVVSAQAAYKTLVAKLPTARV
jgi:hypothetical protein